MLGSPRLSLAVPRELAQSALARRPGAQGRTVGGKSPSLVPWEKFLGMIR